MNAVPNKQDIFSLEKKYWEAMKTNDVEAAVSLTKFPCTITSAKGAQRISEDQYRQMMQIDVSTWVREGDKWVCAFHSENQLQ